MYKIELQDKVINLELVEQIKTGTNSVTVIYQCGRTIRFEGEKTNEQKVQALYEGALTAFPADLRSQINRDVNREHFAVRRPTPQMIEVYDLKALNEAMEQDSEDFREDYIVPLVKKWNKYKLDNVLTL